MFNPRPAETCGSTKWVPAGFQSTAGPETGRSPPLAMPACHFWTFQSTAGPETGRSDITHPSVAGVGFVSIHGRPGDRPLHRQFWVDRIVVIVSIHGRPGDRPLLVP